MTINTTDRTLFQRENTPGGGVYTTIAQVTNIKPPVKKRKKLEQPIHDQDAPVVKYGQYESMTCEIEVAFDNDASGHQQFYSDQDNKQLRSYKIVYPNTGLREQVFSGTIEEIKPGDQSAEGVVQTATITFGLAASPVDTW